MWMSIEALSIIGKKKKHKFSSVERAKPGVVQTPWPYFKGRMLSKESPSLNATLYRSLFIEYSSNNKTVEVASVLVASEA